jgi:hypothetical protein
MNLRRPESEREVMVEGVVAKKYVRREKKLKGLI